MDGFYPLDAEKLDDRHRAKNGDSFNNSPVSRCLPFERASIVEMYSTVTKALIFGFN